MGGLSLSLSYFFLSFFLSIFLFPSLPSSISFFSQANYLSPLQGWSCYVLMMYSMVILSTWSLSVLNCLLFKREDQLTIHPCHFFVFFLLICRRLHTKNPNNIHQNWLTSFMLLAIKIKTFWVIERAMENTQVGSF